MPDPVTIAATVFGGFSALSDAINLYRSFRQKGETPSAEAIEQAMQASETAAKGKKSAVTHLGKIIDDEDLEVIRKNIEKAKKRLRKSLADPANDDAAKDNSVDIADSTICAELRRIKRLNGGSLPGPEYENWWQSHGCAA